VIFAAVKQVGRKKAMLISISVLIAGALLMLYMLFGTAVKTNNVEKIRIRKNWTLQQLSDTLQIRAGLRYPAFFKVLARNMGYSSPKPCHISIVPGDGLYAIVQKLKENRNQTVNVTIQGSMDAESLSRLFASKLEVNADSFMSILKSKSAIQVYADFNDTTWPALFIPNTYNLYAATETPELLKRMAKEYDKFWNPKRIQRSIIQRLTCKEVMTIASIVTKESNKSDEYEKIAGVYINRLRIGMLLQADPTVVFARGKTGRVWTADLAIQSPYNTYLHEGLPPGPICIPNLQSIEAVLNYKQHNYLYFCARADFSGYHDFATNLLDHNRNAAAFHRAMNARGIQ
jgi:UPF0755 protein